MDRRFAETEFVIEATGFERLTLYRNNEGQANRWTWVDVKPWLAVEVGRLGGNPVGLLFTWARIAGRLVLFWEPGTQVFDRVKAMKWLDDHCHPKLPDGSTARITAINFHKFLKYVEEAGGERSPT